MSAFEYSALDPRGRQKKGVLEADSARQVRQQLRDKGWAPLSVEETTQKRKKAGSFLSRRGPSLNVNDLALVTRQIATLVASGLPIEEVLKAVSEQTEKAKVKSMILAVRAKVLEGHGLATAMAEFPNAFPHLYRSTVAAGEQAGSLDLVLNRLADYTENRHQSQQKIQLAALYPAILVFVAIAIVVLLLVKVVPKIIQAVSNAGQELPTITKMLIACSNFLQSYGLYLGIALVLGMLAFNQALKGEKFRLKFHRLLLQLPFINGFVKSSNTARYAATLAILNSSGVPLVDAMKIAGEVLSNLAIKQAVKEATVKVSEGGSLHVALQQSGYFPPMMLHMIASGEASGELDSMLERTAANQQQGLEAKIAALVGMFEPLMLLFMGVVVLTIVAAIMLPIINMNNLVG